MPGVAVDLSGGVVHSTKQQSCRVPTWPPQWCFHPYFTCHSVLIIEWFIEWLPWLWHQNNGKTISPAATPQHQPAHHCLAPPVSHGDPVFFNVQLYFNCSQMKSLLIVTWLINLLLCPQFAAWVDAVVFVFSLEDEISFQTVYNYFLRLSSYRNTAEVPMVLVGTQGACSISHVIVVLLILLLVYS